MTTLTVPPPSDDYLATLVRLATDEFNALDDVECLLQEAYVETYVTAVLDVAALLDVARPGWFRVLDLDELDMDDVNCCVLGQLYADRVNAHDWSHADGFTIGFAELIRPRFESPDLQLGVSSVAPRSVWVAEVARRRELAGE